VETTTPARARKEIKYRIVIGRACGASVARYYEPMSDLAPEARFQPSSGRRVAFFGGSFDPPHLGHLAVARAARAALGLDAVLFAPVGAQPLKPAGTAAGFDERMAMTRLAIASEPEFFLSLADAPRPSGAPNYTIETLLNLRAELPPGSALFCLMGADSFSALRLWHRAAEIPFAAPLIVASRPGWRLDDLPSLCPRELPWNPRRSRAGWARASSSVPGCS